MSVNPININKYLYIDKTPTWKVRSLYFFGIFSWLLIMFGYTSILGIDPFYSFIVMPIFILLSIYHLASFGLNLFYKQFDLNRHKGMINSYFIQPNVDIFLPICGESIEVLRNTWTHVTNIRYKNKTIYVLDDSKVNNDQHRKLAEEFGFIYMERPNKGHMKKAGNLKHTFERSNGEFIAIFDADFAPHPDFLLETLPYMQDPTVGIVQTPQYFDLSDEAYQNSPFAYNAAFAEEPFYRFIQVTRSRFGGAICCGSCALYRRAAIEAIGGPYQIDYSEDAHTGYAISRAGYRVQYIPILLSIGLCPDNQYAFFHQQHRWCMGSMRLMLSKFFWSGKTSWKTKFCFITGFMFYLHHPLIIIFSFHLFWTLFLYNDQIPVGKSLLFYPHLAFAVIYLWQFPIAKLKFGYFGLLMARTYAYSHAVKTALLRKSVSWVSTNAKHNIISHAYQQTIRSVMIFLSLYMFLILIGLRTGDIHLFDLDYMSIQFWLFWNFFLTAALFINLIRTKSAITGKRHPISHLNPATIPKWQLGLYSFLLGLLIGFPFLMYVIPNVNITVAHSQSLVFPVEKVSMPTVTQTPKSTITPSPPLSPTPTVKRLKRTLFPVKKSIQKRDAGGWYWNKELNKAQKWMGLDTSGNDIWID